MGQNDDIYMLSRLRERFRLDEDAIDAIRHKMETEGRHIEDIMVDMGLVSRGGLQSVIGQLPTAAGALDEQTSDDADVDDDEYPTGGHRADVSPLTPESVRSSLLPTFEVGSDRYHQHDEIARGGMGRIVEAMDKTLERTVAVKLLLGGKEQRLGWQLRFTQEAQITGQLQHPNIIPVYDLGQQDDGQLYFTMKRVEGHTLRDVFKALREGKDEAETQYTRTHLLQIFQKICMAVAYAHSRAVVHRDLKPSNIMLGDFGEVLVMDWGLAKILKKAAPAGQKVRSHREDLGRLATRQGEAIGTPGYMPPELALGQLHLVDERSDVFSLGALLYEMLTLKRPYVGRDPQEILQQMLRNPVIPARKRTPGRTIPMDLDAACTRCLERDVSKRFDSVLDLHAVVQRHLEERAQPFDMLSLDTTGDLDRHVQGYFEVALRESLVRQELNEKTAGTLPWSSFEMHRPIRALQAQLKKVQHQLSHRFALAVDVLRARIVRDPDDTSARHGLAQIAREELLRAERLGDTVSSAQCEHILTTLNTGAELLQGDGEFKLDTLPGGADVLLYRMTEVDSVLTPIKKDAVGPTPVHIPQLAMGAYLALVKVRGHRDIRVSFRIARQESLHLSIDTIQGQAVTDGFVFVPAGRALLGSDPDADWPLPRTEKRHHGFFIGRLPVTVREYLRFLNALARSDLAQAHQHVPRNPVSGASLLEYSDGSFFLPKTNFCGQSWDPNWPVFAVSRLDAEAFCRWRSHRDGLLYRLPTELEWEVAARGGDGRAFPWGDQWEMSFCSSAQSGKGAAVLAPVGSHPNDQSPYGLMDLAGGVSEWTSTDFDAENGVVSLCRGGRWNGSDRDARCASRYPLPAQSVHLGVGFRLAYDAE